MKEVLAKTTPEETSDAQIAEIKAAQEKLMQSAQKLFAKMYEQTQGAAGAQGAQDSGEAGYSDMGGASNGASDDDVVDADYKEV